KGSLPENLVHRFAFRKLIDQLIKPANLLHQWICYFLNTYAADYALDEGAVRLHCWRLREEGLEVGTPLDLLLQTRLVIACEPANDTVNLLLCPLFTPGFLHVKGIHRRERRGENSVCGHRCISWWGKRGDLET